MAENKKQLAKEKWENFSNVQKKDLKIGIITLSASDNCGSLLQTYALKRVILQLGFSYVDVINFSSESSHVIYDILPREKYGLLWLIKPSSKTKLQKIRSQKTDYEEFRKNVIQVVPNDWELFPKDLISISDKYDIVVTGSDQVWNVVMGDYDDSFFLQWVTKGKKIAYAPSLGGHAISESKYYERIEQWIKEFDYISVREKSSKVILEEIVEKEVPVLLDPTLLLEKEDWVGLIGERMIEEDYIFFYSWAYQEEETCKIVMQEGKRLGLKVYVIDASKFAIKDAEKWGFYLCEKGGPLAFLNLMYYAEYSFVESFHGIVFSYIFEKNFWVLDTHEDYHELDTRLKEFLDLFDAQDRVVTKYNYKKRDMNKAICYNGNDHLKEKRSKSLQFLKDSLKMD